MKQVGQDLRRKADSAVSNYVQLQGDQGGEDVVPRFIVGEKRGSTVSVTVLPL